MALLALPNELIDHVAWSLESERDLDRLSRSCQAIHRRVTPILYQRNRLFGDNTALKWAARTSMPGTLHQAMRAGTVIADQELTLLHTAAFAGNEEIIRTLVQDCHIPCSETDENGDAPLFLAAKFGKVQAAKALLANGADATTASVRGITAMHAAAFRGSAEIVAMLLDAGAEVSPQVSDDRYLGLTPLHQAARAGATDVVRLLLDHGADPTMAEFSDTVRMSPLTGALYNGYVETAQMLLAAGADASHVPPVTKPPLCLAAVLDDIDLVKLLLEHGARADTGSDDESFFPLLDAAAVGSVPIVQLLLDHGADINVQGHEGNTALHMAIAEGRNEVAELLIAAEADITLVNEEGEQLLHSAVNWDRPEIVTMLLDKEADMKANYDGELQPIASAVSNNQFPIVKMLLEKGADVEDSSSNFTLMGVVCQLGHEQLFPLLLSHGADLSVIDSNGNTLLHYAGSNGHLGIVKRLLEHPFRRAWVDDNKQSPLHHAAAAGHLEIVQLFLEHGFDPFATDRGGNTSLHNAVFGGHIQVVKLLLERGLDPAQVNAIGSTPLHQASLLGHVDILKLLVARGVDRCSVDGTGCTALLRASAYGHPEAVQYLLGLVVNDGHMEKKNNAGYTPLLAAIENGHLGVVDMLLQKGADITVSNLTGVSPLMAAVGSENLDLVKRVLEHEGVDMNKQNVDGRTALWAASRRGSEDVVAVLIAQGKSHFVGNVKDNYGATPLIIAARNGHEQVLAQLLTLDDSLLLDEDMFGHNVFYWAACCGNPEALELLNSHAESTGRKVAEYDDMEQVLFNPDVCYCDVCGRSTTEASVARGAAQECPSCIVGDGEVFMICFYCANHGAKCRDLSHTWGPHDCNCQAHAAARAADAAEESDDEMSDG